MERSEQKEQKVLKEYFKQEDYRSVKKATHANWWSWC